MEATVILISATSPKAFLPLIPFVLKIIGIGGAKKHGISKVISKNAKEIAKDQAKEAIQKKNNKKEEKE